MDDSYDRREAVRRASDQELAQWRGRIEAKVETIEDRLRALDTLSSAVVQMRVDMGVIRQELTQTRVETASAATDLRRTHERQRETLQELLDRKAASATSWWIAVIPPIFTGIVVGVIVIALGGKP